MLLKSVNRVILRRQIYGPFAVPVKTFSASKKTTYSSSRNSSVSDLWKGHRKVVSRSYKMTRRQILLLSSSKVHGHEYLEYAAADINNLFRKNNVSTILFIPYALRDHETYFQQVKEVFIKWGYKINSIHQGNDPVRAAQEAEAFFVGGGNTFQLLKALYDNDVLEVIRKKVLNDGVPYVGSSAGTNVATKSIHTTNDMPIVYPPSFYALDLVPFNINPHYQDPDPSSTHKGETREERILQYQELPEANPVIGLREGCMLEIIGQTVSLKGICDSRLFVPGKPPKEVTPGTDLSDLMKWNK